jgi:hypothetical protein
MVASRQKAKRAAFLEKLSWHVDRDGKSATARALRVSRTALQRWLTGERRPSRVTMAMSEYVWTFGPLPDVLEDDRGDGASDTAERPGAR